MGLGASFALALAVLPAGVLAQDSIPGSVRVPHAAAAEHRPVHGRGRGRGRVEHHRLGRLRRGRSNVSEYDWVHGFQDATGCQVNAKPDDTSDQMVSDMRQRRITTGSRHRVTPRAD